MDTFTVILSLVLAVLTSTARLLTKIVIVAFVELIFRSVRTAFTLLITVALSESGRTATWVPLRAAAPRLAFTVPTQLISNMPMMIMPNNGVISAISTAAAPRRLIRRAFGASREGFGLRFFMKTCMVTYLNQRRRAA